MLFASVVAGVMGNPAGTKGSPSFTDFNELTESGFYRCVGTNSKANKPATSANGILEVIVADGKSSTFRCKQTYTVAVTDYNPDMFERVLNGETWTPWRRIDNFGYNTLAELIEGIGVNLNHITAMAASSSVNVDSLYTLHNSGMTLLNVAANTAGLPLTATGMMIHFQRTGKGSVSESQQIYQIYFATKRYVRRGVGNGTTIIYSDWSEW